MPDRLGAPLAARPRAVGVRWGASTGPPLPPDARGAAAKAGVVLDS
jgi:hypothetical protein